MTRQWAGVTFGGGWMHKCLILLLRIVNPRLLYVFSDIFIIPFCLIFSAGGKASVNFYRRLTGCSKQKARAAAYSNLCQFSEAVIDKFAAYAGRRFEIEVKGQEHFDALADGNGGFIILSSHAGNYEMAGYSLVSDRKAINAVVYSGEKASVMKNRGAMFDKTRNRMIVAGSDMSYLFAIDEALHRGEIVSFPADRRLSGSKCLEHGFLGARARFPQGPFWVTAARSLDALAVNVMKTGKSRYTVYVTPLKYDKTQLVAKGAGQLLDGYVSELERQVRQYPRQWYNFFDFWEL